MSESYRWKWCNSKVSGDIVKIRLSSQQESFLLFYFFINTIQSLSKMTTLTHCKGTEAAAHQLK